MKQQLIELIQTNLLQENFTSALQNAKKLADLDHNDHEADLLYGDIFMKMENWDKAVEHYDRAVYIAPHEANAFFKLGTALEERGNLLAALTQYQSASRLEPNNLRYKGYVGRGFAMKGVEAKRADMVQDGIVLMEQVIGAGLDDVRVYEELALSYLELSILDWTPNPENKEETYPTEDIHISKAQKGIVKAKNLVGNALLIVNNRATELENVVNRGLSRQYVGYKYLLKAPLIIGAIIFVFGAKILGVSLFVMSGLYYLSQRKLVYKINKLLFTDGFKDPFIIRRLDAIGEMMGGISFFGTSLSNVLFMRWFYGMVFEGMRYLCAIIYLPFEIIRGFVVNYGLTFRKAFTFLSDKKAMNEVKNNLTQKVVTASTTAQKAIDAIKKTSETAVISPQFDTKPEEIVKNEAIPEPTIAFVADTPKQEMEVPKPIITDSPTLSEATVKIAKAKPKVVKAKATESFSNTSKKVGIESDPVILKTVETPKIEEDLSVKAVEMAADLPKFEPIIPIVEQPKISPKVVPIEVPQPIVPNNPPQNEVSDTQMRWAIKAIAGLVGLVIFATLFVTFKTSFSTSEVAKSTLTQTETPESKTPLKGSKIVNQPVNMPPPSNPVATNPTETKPSIAYVQLQHSSDLLIREKPTQQSMEVGKIPNGSPVIVLGFEDHETILDGKTNRWCKVNFGGKIGWVWGEFLVEKPLKN
jgi:tetratricopeptide (TPR) repeat protein